MSDHGHSVDQRSEDETADPRDERKKQFSARVGYAWRDLRVIEWVVTLPASVAFYYFSLPPVQRLSGIIRRRTLSPERIVPAHAVAVSKQVNCGKTPLAARRVAHESNRVLLEQAHPEQREAIKWMYPDFLANDGALDLDTPVRPRFDPVRRALPHGADSERPKLDPLPSATSGVESSAAYLRVVPAQPPPDEPDVSWLDTE